MSHPHDGEFDHRPDQEAVPRISPDARPGAAGSPLSEPAPGSYGPGPANPERPFSYSPTPGVGGPNDPSERSMAVLAHLSTLIATLLSAGWLTFAGPLILWLMYRDKSPFVRQAAAGAFNFSLACWIAGMVAWVAFFTIIGIPLTILIGLALVVVTILFPILGAVRANNGETYRYPFLIKVLD